VRRRSAIVEAARGQLRLDEADALAIPDVAAAAGVSVATVYNLVGTRDQLLLAVVDETVTVVEQLAVPDLPGLDGCLSILDAGCEVVLSDPVANRRAIGALGGMTPGRWLGTGLGALLGRWAEDALAAGTLTDAPSVGSLVDLLQFGYRGVLISWVYGLVPDDDLRAVVERQALHVLSDAVPEADRPAVLARLARQAERSDTPGRISA